MALGNEHLNFNAGNTIDLILKPIFNENPDFQSIFDLNCSNNALNCNWFACEWLGCWKLSHFIITFSYKSTIPLGFFCEFTFELGISSVILICCACANHSGVSIACGVNQSISANWNQSALYYWYTTQPHTHLVMSWVRLQATIAFICQTCVLLKHP